MGRSGLEIRQAVLPPAQAQRLLEPLGTIPPAPPKRFIAGTQRLPHKRKHKTTRPQSLPMLMQRKHPLKQSSQPKSKPPCLVTTKVGPRSTFATPFDTFRVVGAVNRSAMFQAASQDAVEYCLN